MTRDYLKEIFNIGRHENNKMYDYADSRIYAEYCYWLECNLIDVLDTLEKLLDKSSKLRKLCEEKKHAHECKCKGRPC